MNILTKKQKYPACVNFGFTIHKSGTRPAIDWIPALEVERLLKDSLPVFSQKDENTGLMLTWERSPERPLDKERDVLGFILGPFAVPEQYHGLIHDARVSNNIVSHEEPKTVEEDIVRFKDVRASVLSLIPESFLGKASLSGLIEEISETEELRWEIMGKHLQEALGNPTEGPEEDREWKKAILKVLSMARVALPVYVRVEGGAFDGHCLSLVPREPGQKYKYYEHPVLRWRVLFTATSAGLVAVAGENEHGEGDSHVTEQVKGKLLLKISESQFEEFTGNKEKEEEADGSPNTL